MVAKVHGQPQRKKLHDWISIGFLFLIVFPGTVQAQDGSLFHSDDIFSCIQPSALFQYEYSPGCNAMARRAKRNYHLSVNQFSLRDKERPKNPAF